MAVSKHDVQSFWAQNVPFFEPTRTLEEISAEYVEFVDAMHVASAPYLHAIRQELARRGRSILEVGCGGGMDSRAFAKLGMQVVSLDLNPRSCLVTSHASKLLSLPMDVVQGDAENLPFINDSFDVVYSFGVLHHTPKTPNAVEEIWRVVRKNAFVMLYNVNLTYYVKRLIHPTLSKQAVSNLYDSTILSQLYSKSDVRKLFKNFLTVTIRSRMFWGGRRSKRLHLVLLLLKYTGLERVYGSFNLIWAEK